VALFRPTTAVKESGGWDQQLRGSLLVFAYGQLGNVNRKRQTRKLIEVKVSKDDYEEENMERQRANPAEILCGIRETLMTIIQINVRIGG